MIKDAVKIAAYAKRLRDECVRYKQPRMQEIKRFFDLYNNVQGPIIPGYFNIPLPIIGGYVETLLSKTDEAVSLSFNPRTEGDYTRAKLITAAWKNDSQAEESDWNYEDRQERKIAIFSGKGIGKVYSESSPAYRSCVEAVEFEDFIFDPLGKEDTETHMYIGQDGIWKTKDKLAGSQYDNASVNEIFEKLAENSRRDEQDEYENKKDRYLSLSLNPFDYAYGGAKIAQFAEMALEYTDGQRYYVFFEVRTGLPVRCGLLTEEISQSNLYPWVTWSTHEDAKNFLNKTPLHDVVPVAEAMQIAFNMTMDNVRKRNMNQKMFRSGMLVDPNQLRNFVPDGLVEVATSAVNTALRDVAVDIETPDTTGITERLITFLDSFIGQKTGVTPSAQGAGQEKQATILMSNLRQVADRLGLLNKYYARAQRRKALRWAWGQYEHMAPKRVLKTIGASGAVEWMTLFRKDARPEFDIAIVSRNAEEENDLAAKKEKADSLTSILANPNLSPAMNPKKTIEAILKNGHYEDEEIAEFMDTDAYGNRDIIAAAVNACEEIMDGKEPTIKINYEANMAFLNKINVFIKKLRSADVEVPKLMALNRYFNAHVEIAVQNEQRAKGLMGMINPTLAAAFGTPSAMPAGAPGIAAPAPAPYGR